MVFLSSKSKNIILDRLPTNGWARSASRHTASATLPTFAFFMLSPPSSTFSLFLSVMSACAQFCHFVVISSDLSIYVDEEMTKHIFKDDAFHPIFSKLPMFTPHVIGTIGFIAHFIITSERCFGNALKHRRMALPLITAYCSTWIVSVFSVWLIDHLVRVILTFIEKNDALKLDSVNSVIELIDNNVLKDLAYPLAHLLPLWFAHYVMWRRIGNIQSDKLAIGIEKKAN